MDRSRLPSPFARRVGLGGAVEWLNVLMESGPFFSIRKDSKLYVK